MDVGVSAICVCVSRLQLGTVAVAVIGKIVSNTLKGRRWAGDHLDLVSAVGHAGSREAPERFGVSNIPALMSLEIYNPNCS